MSAIKDILADPQTEAPSTASAQPAARDQAPEAAVETPRPETSPGDDDTSPKDGAGAATTTATSGPASGSTSKKGGAGASVSSVYSGNKMKHLKKEDGIPLWRKDIQYDFLRLVFYNDTHCFTKYSDGSKNHTFAEIYIDAMAKSSKCSKILKEKLLQDTEGAIAMAMVCLLVNVGRMNTTLNFFPEMRAQLRTYHSIPALQAHQDPNAYKQLQDAPRLKSILKGATEDEPQPSTIEEIKEAQIPRTNPVNLIFVMSQYAPKISEVHFQPPRDFFDLIMRSTLSSDSRARAFLWLLWWYLESNFSYEDSQRNPFGPGQYMEGEKPSGLLPLKVPSLESLTEEQAAAENMDTSEEKDFGEAKRKERITILASEPSPAMTALKRARKEKGLVAAGAGGQHSDDELSDSVFRGGLPYASASRRPGMYHDTASDYTRSPSPAARALPPLVPKYPADMRINHLLNTDDAASETSPPHSVPSLAPKKGPGRGNWRRTRPKPDEVPLAARPQDGQLTFMPNMNFVNESGHHNDPSTPRAHRDSINSGTLLDGSHVPTPSYQAQKRHRGITSHQSAVISHRKQQIIYNLDRRIRKNQIRARDRRELEGPLLRAWRRVRALPLDYDSEGEGIKLRKARERAAEKDDDVIGGAGLREKPQRGGGKENIADVSVGDDGNEAGARPRVLYAGYVRAPSEPNDVGEEMKTMAAALRRCGRRLERWSETMMPGQAALQRRDLGRSTLYGRKRRRGDAGDAEGAMRSSPVANKRKRSSTVTVGGRRSSSRRIREKEGKMDVEMDDEGDRDRDLGEADGDESADEGDEDEDMVDD